VIIRFSEVCKDELDILHEKIVEWRKINRALSTLYMA